MKGTVIISETLLEIVSVIISFVMIVLVVQLVFSTQTQTTYQTALTAVARDISSSIDRVVASAGSMTIQEDIPKGMQVNVSIDYKTVLVSSNNNIVRKSFSGLTNAPPVSYLNPTTLCIVKTHAILSAMPKECATRNASTLLWVSAIHIAPREIPECAIRTAIPICLQAFAKSDA